MFDLMPIVLRMTEKLCKISDLAENALVDADMSGRVGARYMILNKGIGQVADLVKDTMAMRNYWYMKFSEEGLLKGSGNPGAGRAGNVAGASRPGEKGGAK